jgi:autotransporter-associated beta strand protein
VTNSGALTLGANQSLRSLTGTGSVNLGSNTLTLNNATTTPNISGAISGTGGALTMAGTGTVTVSSNSNTYTGGTTISAGTLLVNNSSSTASGTGTGVLAVNGGTLGGNGYIGTAGSTNGAITVASGASIAAGANSSTLGTLTSYSTSGVTFQAGSNYTWKVSGSSGDEVAANKLIFGPTGYNLSSASPFTVYVMGSNTQGPGQSTSYVIATSPGAAITLNGSAMSTGIVSSQDFVVNTTGFTDSNATTAWQLDVATDGSGQELVLVDSTPEPGSLGLLGAAALGLLRRRRNNGCNV